MLLTLDTVGRIIGLTIGMANAEVFNPSISSQASAWIIKLQWE
ncbi:MAG: hypothetical protein CM15mP62_28930 [Rhodospirillaceae bacterium]|nr:MAG: hypothetical protein CM15mP62_28930 [Rhodospirillaceae bacterium]